jgi:hypothetical protein
MASRRTSPAPWYFVTVFGHHVSGQVLRVDGGDQTWPA